jgi:RND family efflux transporter MFP subunit
MGTAFQDGNWRWLVLSVLLLACCAGGAGYYLLVSSDTAEAQSQDEADQKEQPAALQVEVVHPEKGKLPRVTKLPGSVESFDSARIYAEVSGYIKRQVDLGTKVKRGDVLIELDVPELEKQRDKWKAMVVQAKARVKQAEARRSAVVADRKAADAKIVQAEASAKSAKSWRKFRDLQHHRTETLFATRSIEEQLVDESKERFEAAVETENAALAAIKTAEAEREAVEAKVLQADADIDSAKADVEVAEAELARAKVMVNFATIKSPYDGYVTQRSTWPGDYVKAGAEGAGNPPLLTVERTDVVRVVVQIPDRDVPYCDEGDPAIVEIDALPGKPRKGKVTLIGHSEDSHTKLMRAEIHLKNERGRLRQGMFGWVTIVLDPEAEQLSIPSVCLVGRTTQEGKASVYVVRDGRAQLVPVQIGMDNGKLVAIQSGLKPTDQVIIQAPPALHDGDSVVVGSSQAP